MDTPAEKETNIKANNVCEQPSISKIKIQNPSRPVVSTIEQKHGSKKRGVFNGSAVQKGDTAMDEANEEIQRLRHEVRRLKENLTTAESKIKMLMKRDREMTNRLSEELQRHVKHSGKFENLSHGGLRLNQLIDRFETLYTQGRIDALDELDEIKQLKKMKKREEIKTKIMVGVMIASFRICHEYARLLRQSFKKLLGLSNAPSQFPTSSLDADIELRINEYLQATTEKFNIENMVKDVEDQLQEILPEFPESTTSKPHMASYICECVRISWAIANQIPPVEIEYSSERYNSVMHRRFFTSDDKNNWIKLYAWPTLVNAKDKNILSKGVVIT